jgi:hypothetical protein
MVYRLLRKCRYVWFTVYENCTDLGLQVPTQMKNALRKIMDENDGATVTTTGSTTNNNTEE